MPHLVLEYTANLRPGFRPDDALRAANKVLIASGLFVGDHIKSRAVLLDHYKVADADKGEAFIHARLQMHTGRSNEEKRTLTHGVVEALAAAVSGSRGLRVQLTCEAIDFDRDSYAKTVIES